MLKKILSIFGVFFVLVSAVIVPCSATTTSNDDAGNDVYYEPYLLWDTFGFYMSGYDFSVPFPYSSVGFSDTTDTTYPQAWVELEYPAEGYNSVTAAFSATRSATFSRVAISCKTDTGTPTSMLQHYTLSSSTPWQGNVVSVWNSLRTNAMFSLPSAATAHYTMSITCIVPVTIDGISLLKEKTYTYTAEEFTNSGTTATNMYMYPTASNMFGSDISHLSTVSCIVTNASWSLQVSGPLMETEFIFRMPIYATDRSSTSSSVAKAFVHMWDQYPNVEVVYQGDVDFTTWLSSALGGFWNAEFFPGFTFGGLAGVLISLVVLVLVAKYFMGG